jgi:SAM-dependent methyltransferase
MLFHDTVTPDRETASLAYAQRFSGRTGQYLLQVQEDCVRDLLAPYRGRIVRALDVGGGHGQLTRLLRDFSEEFWVHGSDETCFQQAFRQHDAVAGRPNKVASSLLHLPFPDRSFDLVTGVRLLAHVERWEALLTEMMRVSNGLVLIDFAPWNSMNFFEPALFEIKRWAEGNTRPFFCHWPHRVRAVFRSGGFTTQVVAKQFSVPMVVHRALRRPTVSRGLERVLRGLAVTRALGSPALMLAVKPGQSTANP